MCIRDRYNWVIENIFGTEFPKQREFARLNMTNTAVSYTHLVRASCIGIEKKTSHRSKPAASGDVAELLDQGSLMGNLG